MTVTLSTTQVQERCTVTFVVAGAASPPFVSIIIDGKEYGHTAASLIPGTLYTFIYDATLERGPHVIYGMATDSGVTVSTSPITIVMAYELVDYGIDIYSGNAKLDVLEPLLHDALLPDLPTLNFSCAALLDGAIGSVIRERGLRKYQFTIETVTISGPLYVYTCKAAESYAMTSAIMALQTAYGSTANAIRLLMPLLNIVGTDLLTQTTYPQLFNNITPTEVIKQLMIQALAQASVRNGNLYVFLLDVSAQIPDYHMQRTDPLTGWQRDADVYDAVVAHYVVKQYPTPDTVLTLHDAANWSGAVSDVTQVATTLLLPPSGAFGMLKSVGNCSRAGLNAAFKNFDRIRFNWCPVPTGATVTVSLQQDASNKLELTHTFAGQQSSGFVLGDAGTVPTDTLTKTIILSSAQYISKVKGVTTANCSYRVTLLRESGITSWQDVWSQTIGNTFEANVPWNAGGMFPALTVLIEFKDLYLVGANYGVQCVQCDITVQTYTNVGSHEQVVSTTTRTGSVYCYGDTTSTWLLSVQFGPTPTLTAAQRLVIGAGEAQLTHSIESGGSVSYGHFSWALSAYVDATSHIVADAVTPYQWRIQDGMSGTASVTISILETVQDYAWISSFWVWSAVFNLFEDVTIPFADMTRTGNPVNLQTIALTFAGDNYVDTLALVASNPLPVTVKAGTGSRAYPVTDDFGSEAGAQAYADGLLPIASVAREQYTRDVPLATDLSVGDTVNADGVNMTVYAIDYRADGKTIAAGRAMDTLMTLLSEQSRRLGALERKG